MNYSLHFLHRTPMSAFRPALSTLAVSTSLLVAPIVTGLAQQFRVSVTHYAAPSTAEIDRAAFHWKPGAGVRDSTFGLPSSSILLVVPPGEQVCYVIHGANPLLYQYTMTAIDVPVVPSPDLSAIAKELGTLIPKSDKDAKFFDEMTTMSTVDSINGYRAIVRELGVTMLGKAADIRSNSDRQATFAAAYVTDSSLWSTATKANALADTIYMAFSQTTRNGLQDIRGLQLFAFAALETSHKAIEGAAAAMQPGHEALMLCKPMPTGRTRFGLTIAARQGLGSVKPSRTRSSEKESLAQFVLDPEYVERFRVAPGLFVAGLFDQDRSVGVSNGHVTIEPTGRTYSRTGMFAMARATDHVWPTIGVAKGDASSVDVFVGVQLRAGNFVFGPELSIGLGVAWMEVPVGAGALRTGDALPDKTKLEDIISRDRHFGFGLTFTLSGLTFGKADKPSEGGPK